MNISIMQPYFFPYLGYFQMVQSANKFIFYDDVNYIKGGWVNRNRIIINSKATMITLPLDNASSFRQINEIRLNNYPGKLLKTIKQAYCKATYFNQVFPIIEDLFLKMSREDFISKIAAESVMQVSRYIGIDVVFEFSSHVYPHTCELKREERIYQICKENNAINYVNAPGGEGLYDKEQFIQKGLNLYFLRSLPIEYDQGKTGFIPNLSIIDVLMHNSKKQVEKMVKSYELL